MEEEEQLQQQQKKGKLRGECWLHPVSQRSRLLLLLDYFILFIMFSHFRDHYFFFNTFYVPAFVLSYGDKEFHDLKGLIAYWVCQDGDNWKLPWGNHGGPPNQNLKGLKGF